MRKLISAVLLGGMLVYVTMSFSAQSVNLAVPQLKKVTPKVSPKKSYLIEHQGLDSNDVHHLFPRLPERLYDSIFLNNLPFLADGFDFPVGKPDATNYFKAQKFGQRLHLGEDWNGTGGGNTDLGDPVYSTANGLVTFAEDVCCGWGNVVRVVHRLPNHNTYIYVESLYAHMHNINVKVGELVQRGQQLGTIGTAKGRYSAHLHFEMRDFINMSIGPGYSEDKYGYLSPTSFIEQNRP